MKDGLVWGIVARNHEGVILFAAISRVRVWDGWGLVEIAEAKSQEVQIKLERRYGYNNIILKSDFQSL